MPLPRARKIAISIYRLALVLGFALLAIQLYAALSLGLFVDLLPGSWSGWWYVVLLANPFVTLFVRRAMSTRRATPRNIGLLGLGSLAVSAAFLLWVALR